MLTDAALNRASRIHLYRLDGVPPMPEQFKYRAFISDSHADGQWAHWRHRVL